MEKLIMSSLRKPEEKVNGNILGANFKSILVVMDCAKREHIVQFVHPTKQCHMLPRALKIANSELGIVILTCDNMIVPATI